MWAALALYLHVPLTLTSAIGDPEVPMAFVSFEYVTVIVM